jgi:peptidoglycan-N-acetylglucosamine deacetylase
MLLSGHGLRGELPRYRSWLVYAGLIATLGSAALPSQAAECQGNPDALGTSRTLVVDPREHPRIGSMQYAETLPLDDREVVLTFDDGPLPRASNAVLDILARECVKATFFVVGRMAREFPDGVRKLRDAGHTIGTHSQNHPLNFQHRSISQAQQEVDEGIAATLAALNGDTTALAPFFRVPGLLRADAVESYLASQGIQTWSADFPADDWRHISADQVFKLAMSRLEAKGKGILLLHDIQPRTVAALPRMLSEMKSRGYRIVHVVPATPERLKTATEPRQWRLHPTSEEIALIRWPNAPRFVFMPHEMLPGPSIADLGLQADSLAWPGAGRRHSRGVPLPKLAPWPRLTPFAKPAAATLPVPEGSLFSIPERGQPMIRAMASTAQRHAALAAARPVRR